MNKTGEQCGCNSQINLNNSCRYSNHDHHQQQHNVTANMQMATELLKCYEEKMIDHIYQVPHTPPTLFEMKIQHGKVKKDLLRMYEKNLNQMNTKDDMIKYFLQHLEHSLDIRYNSIVELAMKEYKMCQTGFIIGWKDDKRNKNKNNNDVVKPPIDDRF